MDRGAACMRGFDGMKETRDMIKRGLNQNCQKKPDFIEDVLLQKYLYASYDMIQANPAYEPTYTFTDPNSPSNEFNPTSLLNETDKHRTFVTGEHGVRSKADCSYGTNKGNILPTVKPIFNTVVEGHDYEDPSTQVWQQDINVNLMPEVCAEGDIPRKAFCGLCMDQDGQDVDLVAVDAPELTMNRTSVERTIDVSDYDVDPFIQVEQKSINIEEGLKLSHIENKIINELAHHEVDQKGEGADLDISDLPQLSTDAIPMESILEGSVDEEVPFMHVDYDNINMDSLGQMLAGIEQYEAMSGLFTDKGNREAVVLERNVCSSVPLDTSLGKPSLEGQSWSKSPINSGERHRRSRSLSCGRYRSPTNRRNWCSPSKLLMQSRSPVKSRDRCYRRSTSRSVTKSSSIHRRSCFRSRSGIYSRYHRRRSDSQSRVNSRDNHRRSKSRLIFGMDSRDCSKRTRARSRSPITLRDRKRRSRSRPPSNSKGFRRSRSRSVTNFRRSHRRSRSRSRSGVYSRYHHRRSYSRSAVNSRDCHRRSQSRLKVGMDSRDCNRRTWSRSRSRSPITFRDQDRRSSSRSRSNSRGSHSRSRSESPRGLSDL